MCMVYFQSAKEQKNLVILAELKQGSALFFSATGRAAILIDLPHT